LGRSAFKKPSRGRRKGALCLWRRGGSAYQPRGGEYLKTSMLLKKKEKEKTSRERSEGGILPFEKERGGKKSARDDEKRKKKKKRMHLHQTKQGSASTKIGRRRFH